MLIRCPQKLVLLIVPLLFLGWIISRHRHRARELSLGVWSKDEADNSGSSPTEDFTDDDGEDSTVLFAGSKDIIHLPIPPGPVVEVDDDEKPIVYGSSYNEVRSLTTDNGEFIRVHFGGIAAYNPNIIPHPTRHDLWIVVAQQEQSQEASDHIITELTCNAGFLNGVLTCAERPTPLPLTVHEPHCEGDMAYFNFGLGARDARVVHGPDAPYILYGSHSQQTCLGVWIQDLRVLVEDYAVEAAISRLFTSPAELRRPPPHKQLEKNFFAFWDQYGKLYVHHDIWPRRVFAQVEMDGDVGPDLAPQALAAGDDVCMSRYMPVVGPEHESIHQATNSLAITLCERADPGCKPDASNTFIMHIFHFKTFYDFHGVYEPYVVLFQQQAPFAIHAIAKRPLWIHGRDLFSEQSGSVLWQDKQLPTHHSEMFYVTSMSWKAHGQRYHGYIDDVLFLAFGIEDSRPAVMDVRAGDLLRDMGYCADVVVNKPQAVQQEI
jgi:hypothetical protein